MNFGEILTQAYDRTGHSGTTDSVVVRRIKGFANRWNRKILTTPGLEALRRTPVTFASVADQAQYGLPVEAVRYVSEADTQRKLYKRTIGWYRERFPNPAGWTGTPRFFVPMGYSRFHTAPSAACELFAVSSAAGDITQAVRAEVVLSSGYKRTLGPVTLTGATPVSLGASVTNVIGIDDWFLSAVATGTVTLTQGSGGTELARIPIGKTYQRFTRFALAPTPAAVITYTADVLVELADMVQDTDEPFPNANYHDLIVDGIVHDEFASRGRLSEARLLLIDIQGQDYENGLGGRIGRIRGELLEWPDREDDDGRTFEDSIRLPVT